jgi:hypothetical protein
MRMTWQAWVPVKTHPRLPDLARHPLAALKATAMAACGELYSESATKQPAMPLFNCHLQRVSQQSVSIVWHLPLYFLLSNMH